MKKLVLAAVLLCGMTEGSGQTEYSTTIKDQIRQVENNLAGRIIVDKPFNLHERMDHFNVKGLSIAVVQNYKLVWAKGYGWANQQEKRLVTTATLFKPGSISKSLNAVGILKLAQDNKLGLYDDINKYLKSWKFPYDSLSKGKKITLANLLSHTAGLSVYGGFPGYEKKDRTPTLPEILDGVPPANTPPVRSLSEPGVEFQYSGGGILISQLIITDLTGQSYEKFMYDSVLKPFRMVNSFYSAAPPSTHISTSIAKGYKKDGTEVEATFHIYPEQAALGLWTTPTELCGYLTEIQLAYKGKSQRVLDQEMARLHLTPYIDQSATMGAFIGERSGEKYFFHDAGNEGFRGLFYGSVEGGNGVAIFVNSDDGDIILELLNSVASVYHWKGFEKPAIVHSINIPDSLAKKYVGVYLYDGIIAEVTRKSDGLYFWTNDQDTKMYFTSLNDFINVEFIAEKSFMTDNGGSIIGYSRKVDGKYYPPATKLVSLDSLKAKEAQINNFGRHLLDTKRFDESIVFLKRGKALEPDNINIQVNLAHCFLFKNEYEKAIQLYNICLAQKSKDETQVKALIAGDFDFFRKNKFDNILIVKAVKALGLQ